MAKEEERRPERKYGFRKQSLRVRIKIKERGEKCSFLNASHRGHLWDFQHCLLHTATVLMLKIEIRNRAMRRTQINANGISRHDKLNNPVPGFEEPQSP